MQSISEHTDTIKAETLATELSEQGSDPAEGFTKDVKVESTDLAIALRKS
jgi:hypothetical protein